MNGAQIGQFRDAIVGAFSPDEFDMFLFERLDFDRPVEIADGPFKLVVNSVLRKLEKEGTIAALLAEVAAVRPCRDDLQKLFGEFKAAVDEAQKKNVNKDSAAAYMQVGLAPQVVLQQGGESVSLPPGAKGAGKLEKIVEPLLQLIDIALWRERMVKREGRICRIEINGVPTGTGFLVGPDVVLTNYHVLAEVIEGTIQPKAVQVRFDYKLQSNADVQNGDVARLVDSNEWLIDSTPCTPQELVGIPDAVVPTHDQLDHALIRLDRKVGTSPIPSIETGGRQRGWIEVPVADPTLYSRMPLIILQHPRGAPLKAALDTQGVIGENANRTRVRYKANTEAGSSGSPCFDMDLTLVALHHYGDPAFHHQPGYNQGIPIRMIRDRLQRVGKVAALGGPSE